MQTDKLLRIDDEDHFTLIEEDHRRRLRDMLIEGIAEFSGRMGNNNTFDSKETVQNLVNVIFDCRSLYQMTSDEYTTSFEKLASLRAEITDWIHKLVARRQEEDRPMRGSQKSIAKPPIGFRPESAGRNNYSIHDRAFSGEIEENRLRLGSHKQLEDSSGCSLSTIVRSGTML